MSTIMLVRHGQASAGTSHYDRLSELGRTQAHLLGRWWRHTDQPLDALFSGSLERQRDTAVIATAAAGVGAPCAELKLLDEYDHQFVDRLFSDGGRSDVPGELTFSDYVRIMQRWRDATVDMHEGLESWAVFSQRGWQALETVARDAGESGNAVLFTSGGVIATVLGRLLNLDFERTLDALWRLRNTSVTTVDFRHGTARLVDFNTVGHLHARGDPSLVTQI